MSTNNRRPLALIILDGWGLSGANEDNAIAAAHTPYYDEIRAAFPGTVLEAGGTRVGLSHGERGNPEVGHLNLGAGSVVETVTTRIRRSLATGEFFDNAVLFDAFANVANGGSSIHLIGMLSDSGIHSSMDVLYALPRMAKNAGASNVFVHGFLDGRDVAPRTADIYVEALEIKMAEIGVGAIASLCGRFYGMDSEGNWDRTARAFTMLVHAEGERSPDAVSAIRGSFLRGISDEFIAPIVIEQEPGVPVATIKDGDTVIFFNHKADAMRQLCRSLAVADPGSPKPQINAVCLTEYDSGFELPVAFGSEQVPNTLASVLENNRVKIYRITERARAEHLTRIFDGGSEAENAFESSIIFESTQTIDSAPESQSFKIADAFIQTLEADGNAVFVVNMPAADPAAAMGNREKVIESIQYIDTCLGGIVAKIREANGIAVITSSHSNAELMRGMSSGATADRVPFHIVGDSGGITTLREGGSLEDVAPTILGLLNIERPKEMTGRDLKIL